MTVTVTSLAINPEPALLALGTLTGHVVVIDLFEEDRIFSASLSGTKIESLCLSEDGGQLMAWDDSANAKVWELGDGNVVDELSLDFDVMQCFIVDRQVYVTRTSDGQAQWWSVKDGRLSAAIVSEEDGAVINVNGLGLRDKELFIRDGFKLLSWDSRQVSVDERIMPVDGSELVYMDGLQGLSRNGAYYFLHWDDACLFDRASGEQLYEGEIIGEASEATVSDTGMLAIGNAAGQLFVLDAAGSQLAEVSLFGSPIEELQWAGSTDQLVVRSAEGEVALCDHYGFVLLSNEEIQDILA